MVICFVQTLSNKMNSSSKIFNPKVYSYRWSRIYIFRDFVLFFIIQLWLLIGAICSAPFTYGYLHEEDQKEEGAKQGSSESKWYFLTLSIFTCDIYYQHQVPVGLVYAKTLLTSSGTIFMFSYLSSLSLNQYLYRLGVVFFFFSEVCIRKFRLVFSWAYYLKSVVYILRHSLFTCSANYVLWHCMIGRVRLPLAEVEQKKWAHAHTWDVTLS